MTDSSKFRTAKFYSYSCIRLAYGVRLYPGLKVSVHRSEYFRFLATVVTRFLCRESE
ncbi:hypothetical protein PILCRDRAFT_818822 [Piloderma croceum F 1598]|uniref:Uncharacterized protein n=1 Tax=Piloderma croceum (strain F 1598) TaxID=765440 RepID=A0A0C3C2K3_PILCF|nr:hypothetical protein PILCRDRAFT_818822 [Piloderma croceum F 1598]